jgi:hypothetical protein
MNQQDVLARANRREALERRAGKLLAARLSERSESLGPELSERLRVGRELALDRAREARRAAAAPASAVVGNGAGTALLGKPGGWRFRFAAMAPLAVLVGGLLLIQDSQTRAQISVAAEVDAALLSDDLPLQAYSDPGFAEYLKGAPGP